VQRKAVGDLIDAAHSLPEGLTGGEPIRIMGYGPDEAMLRDKDSLLQAADRVPGQAGPGVRRGRVVPEPRLLSPSRTTGNGDAEGFGMAHLEAALQSVPVVAYHRGGVREAVADGHTGVLVSEGDVDGLAAGMGRLLADPALAATMGAAGRRRVLRNRHR
jgi:colanic acid/amylovoran biosynthesis glycosyltransferase